MPPPQGGKPKRPNTPKKRSPTPTTPANSEKLLTAGWSPAGRKKTIVPLKKSIRGRRHRPEQAQNRNDRNQPGVGAGHLPLRKAAQQAKGMADVPVIVEQPVQRMTNGERRRKDQEDGERQRNHPQVGCPQASFTAAFSVASHVVPYSQAHEQGSCK